MFSSSPMNDSWDASVKSDHTSDRCKPQSIELGSLLRYGFPHWIVCHAERVVGRSLHGLPISGDPTLYFDRRMEAVQSVRQSMVVDSFSSHLRAVWSSTPEIIKTFTSGLPVYSLGYFAQESDADFRARTGWSEESRCAEHLHRQRKSFRVSMLILLDAMKGNLPSGNCSLNPCHCVWSGCVCAKSPAPREAMKPGSGTCHDCTAHDFIELQNFSEI